MNIGENFSKRNKQNNLFPIYRPGKIWIFPMLTYFYSINISYFFLDLRRRISHHFTRWTNLLQKFSQHLNQCNLSQLRFFSYPKLKPENLIEEREALNTHANVSWFEQKAINNACQPPKRKFISIHSKNSSYFLIFVNASKNWYYPRIFSFVISFYSNWSTFIFNWLFNKIIEKANTKV